jgi:DNA-binding transcriptional MocR family regulator
MLLHFTPDDRKGKRDESCIHKSGGRHMKRVAAKRLERMGSAIFAELAEWKEQARENGRDMIDLSIGSPDLPPSPKIMETLKNEVMNPGGYGYPSSKGEAAFREAVADWYGYRFRVPLDPKNEVIALMGSQDGLAHLALSVADPGDLGLVPDPGYPIYSAGRFWPEWNRTMFRCAENTAICPIWRKFRQTSPARPN